MIDYNKLPLRHILCVDVKSFFASVEAARRGIDPLEAYMVVTSHVKRQGSVILASSPKVKEEFQIKTGNRLFEVPKNDKITIVEPSMALYLDIAIQIGHIFESFAAPEDILTYSIDEAFIDVTATTHLFGNPWEMAEKIKKKVYDETGLYVTIGIGDNPLLSKLALDNEAKKTKEQIAYWGYEDIPKTLWKKIPKLTDMWGISRGYEKKFNALGIFSVYDLAHFPKEILERKFGILGLQHYYHANGVDYSRLSERVKTKNKGFSKSQVLFSDYESREDIAIIIQEMVEQLAIRLRKHHYLTSGISLYLGAADHAPGLSLSKSLSHPTKHTGDLVRAFLSLFHSSWRGEAIRTVNVSCHGLKKDNYEQLDLLTTQEEERQGRLEEALDFIRDKYGKTAIHMAHSLENGSTFFERTSQVGGHKDFSEVTDEVFSPTTILQEK